MNWFKAPNTNGDTAVRESKMGAAAERAGVAAEVERLARGGVRVLQVQVTPGRTAVMVEARIVPWVTMKTAPRSPVGWKNVSTSRAQAEV
ncbi:MAG: hypothetical protein U0531_11500 [Dehalococcoidia bacterium]